jgi:hypothetical protein
MSYIFLTILALIPNGLAQNAEYKIFLVIIDGARIWETLEDVEHNYIPHIWNDLAPIGAISSNIWNYGDAGFTLYSVESILTGTYPCKAPCPHNRTNFFPLNPTIFEYYRKQRKIEKNDTWFIGGKWEGSEQLVHSTDVEFGVTYMGSLFRGKSYCNDTEVYESTISILQKYHPRLVVVHLPEVDCAGHTGNWDYYTNSIKMADSIVYMLWNFLQDDPFYKDKTILIVTNDHGRTAEKFADHGANDGIDNRVMYLAVGPGIKRGEVLEGKYQLVDIAPTIGHILNFSVVRGEGKVIEMFEEKVNDENIPHKTNTTNEKMEKENDNFKEMGIIFLFLIAIFYIYFKYGV